MASTFFFYDLETSGFNPRAERIMQFAGQRTDMDLNPIGEPTNELIRLSPDVLPSVQAVLLTGITPQQTISDGLTEVEFLKQFYKEVVQPGTIFVGFNSIRFDDEFMRFLHYRNFYDAYEWQWKDGNSRWDVLDLVRMTRALRPDGIKWPFASDGKPANRLEYLSKINKLDHDHAHDALSDVKATIAMAKLIKTKQPELFDYLLKHRDKKSVKEMVLSGKPFIYTSGRYSSEFQHTTAAVLLAKHPEQDAALVYDLRFDPTLYLKMTVDDLTDAWRYNPDPDAVRFPVKTMKYNRSPTIAPLGVIKDEASQANIGINLESVAKNLAALKSGQVEFAKKIEQVINKLDDERERDQTTLIEDQQGVDERLYESFVGTSDKNIMSSIRSASPDELSKFSESLTDERLKQLLPLYKARNYRKHLSEDEIHNWEEFCKQKLFAGGASSVAAKYFEQISKLSQEKITDEQRYLLEELKLYGESILPVDEDG